MLSEMKTARRTGSGIQMKKKREERKRSNKLTTWQPKVKPRPLG